MQRFRKLLFVTILGAVSCAFPRIALCAGNLGAEQELKEFADYNLTICGTGARRAINEWRAGRQVDEQYEFGDCIAEARTEGKKLYTTVLAKVSGKNQAEAALKDYFATWLTALANVKPNGYETIRSYNDRQSEYAVKVDLMWNKFELEN
ncbi:hypothetical protein [Janthinobacterium fluminis]|uniref:Uncharacterized protein n=1 Tax=Janthinobacterium fluminis TaxID=2987524 RepID=A0ABT5K5F0_9BURK|nr:hypothetical protein [Janthinobacterium fluminis]MDC8759670.1 hypothetical protein [Janthinobacterium fluminis]